VRRSLLFLCGHLDAGGVERSLVDILRHLDERFDVDLVLLERRGDYVDRVPERVRVRLVDLTRIEGPFLPTLARALRGGDGFAAAMRTIVALRRVAGNSALSLGRRWFPFRPRYDCAIAFRTGFCADVLGRMVTADRKVAWWHHGEFDYDGPREAALRETLSRVDQVVAVSQGCRAMLESRPLGLAGRLVVVPNMIDVEDIRAAASTGRPAFESAPRSGPVLVSVGRLSPENTMIDCVDACRLLVERGLSPRRYLVGEGDERPRIERAIASAGLREHVVLLGKIPDAHATIAAADVLVHPSRIESFALTVLEALALRVPSVVARSMGPSEYLVDGRDALVVEPGPASLAAGVERLIGDPDLRATLAGDHASLLDRYSPDRVMKRVLRDVLLVPELADEGGGAIA